MTTPMSSAQLDTPAHLQSTAGVDLGLLGGFELRIDGAPVNVPEASQRVVAVVAMHKRPVPRRLVASSLWPERSEARAHANLRSCLWRLGEAGAGASVVGEGTSLAVPANAAVDLHRLESVGWKLREGASPVDLRSAATLFTRPLLPGWYDDWVVMERERLSHLQARFLERLVDVLVAAGELTRAIDYALHLVQADPLRERSQLCLLRVYAAEGSWGQFHGRVAVYEDLLMETFGCGASAAFRSTVEMLLPHVASSVRSDE